MRLKFVFFVCAILFFANQESSHADKVTREKNGNKIIFNAGGRLYLADTVKGSIKFLKDHTSDAIWRQPQKTILCQYPTYNKGQLAVMTRSEVDQLKTPLVELTKDGAILKEYVEINGWQVDASTDGSRILYGKTIYGEDRFPHSNIFLFDLNKMEEEVFLVNSDKDINLQYPQWISETDEIAVLESRYSEQEQQIISVNLIKIDANGKQHRLSLPAKNYVGFRISPDGNKLAYSTIEESEIFVMDLNNFKSKQVTFDKTFKSFIKWDNSGQKIFYSGQTKGLIPKGIIQVVDLGSGETNILIKTPGVGNHITSFDVLEP